MSMLEKLGYDKDQIDTAAFEYSESKQVAKIYVDFRNKEVWVCCYINDSEAASTFLNDDDTHCIRMKDERHTHARISENSLYQLICHWESMLLDGYEYFQISYLVD